MQTSQEHLDALEVAMPGLVIKTIQFMSESNFRRFWRFDAARWTGGMKDSIYLPIVTAKVELLSPSTGDWSQEKSIIGDNFFRR